MPLTTQQSGQQSGLTPRAAPSGDRYRVLLVDDSAVYRGLVRRELEKHADIEVVGSCGDVGSAVRTLTASPADVVVLDM